MRKDLMQMATYIGIGIGIAAMSASFAQTGLAEDLPLLALGDAEWAKNVTVLVIAPDGTWAAATEPSFDEAFTKAIASCKSKYRHEIGCGYRSTAIRAGWSLAVRCGRESIIVTAKSLEAAKQAAVVSELRLRRDYRPGMPPCVQVASVDPDGRITASDVAQLPQAVVEQTR